MMIPSHPHAASARRIARIPASPNRRGQMARMTIPRTSPRNGKSNAQKKTTLEIVELASGWDKKLQGPKR